MRLTIDQVSTDSRSRRRRTLRPDQRTLPLDELADADAIYGYSFIVTNLDVSTPDRAVAVEHWYRHRTSSTLRHRLIATPARLIRHARTLTLRPAPSHRDLLLDILNRLRALPAS